MTGLENGGMAGIKSPAFRFLYLNGIPYFRPKKTGILTIIDAFIIGAIAKVLFGNYKV
jgi:hypothetical protein